jgi:hypothetical protein
MTGHSLAEVVGAAGIFTAITVTIWQLFATWRAKVQLSREGQYHKLADAALVVQEHTDLQLREIKLHLEDMRDRLVSLERILKEVE